MKTVLIVNLEVKDNHEEAAIGARLTLDLCQDVCFIHVIVSSHCTYTTSPLLSDFLWYTYFCVQIEAVESWEESIDDIVSTFEKQHRRKLLYSVSFY